MNFSANNLYASPCSIDALQHFPWMTNLNDKKPTLEDPLKLLVFCAGKNISLCSVFFTNVCFTEPDSIFFIYLLCYYDQAIIKPRHGPLNNHMRHSLSQHHSCNVNIQWLLRNANDIIAFNSSIDDLLL